MAKPRPAPRETTAPSPPPKLEEEKAAQAWEAFDELVAEFGGKVEFRPGFDTDRGRMRL